MKQTSNPVEALTQDHDAALQRLQLLEAGAHRLSKGGDSQAIGTIGQVLQFLDTDIRQHMRREEEGLFLVLERHIGREGGPIGVMLMEHDMLWGKVAELQRLMESAKLDRGEQAIKEVSEVATFIAQLLRDHIEKENSILFPLAQDILTPAEISEVARKWEAIGSR